MSTPKVYDFVPNDVRIIQDTTSREAALLVLEGVHTPVCIDVGFLCQASEANKPGLVGQVLDGVSGLSTKNWPKTDSAGGPASIDTHPSGFLSARVPGLSGRYLKDLLSRGVNMPALEPSAASELESSALASIGTLASALLQPMDRAHKFLQGNSGMLLRQELDPTSPVSLVDAASSPLGFRFAKGSEEAFMNLSKGDEARIVSRLQGANPQELLTTLFSPQKIETLIAYRTALLMALTDIKPEFDRQFLKPAESAAGSAVLGSIINLPEKRGACLVGSGDVWVFALSKSSGEVVFRSEPLGLNVTKDDSRRRTLRLQDPNVPFLKAPEVPDQYSIFHVSNDALHDFVFVLATDGVHGHDMDAFTKCLDGRDSPEKLRNSGMRLAFKNDSQGTPDDKTILVVDGSLLVQK